VVELPLAGVCVWLSYHTRHLAERTIILLMRSRDLRALSLRAFTGWRGPRGRR
jgi:hypothetical protein